MAVTDLKNHEITEKIIGCAMKVHRYFGPVFPEIVCKRALTIELERMHLHCLSEVERELYYEGKLIYRRRLELLIEHNSLTELKAVGELGKDCSVQIINYLRVFDMEVGLLLNFGSRSLQFKRFINTKQSVKSQQSMKS